MDFVWYEFGGVVAILVSKERRYVGNKQGRKIAIVGSVFLLSC